MRTYAKITHVIQSPGLPYLLPLQVYVARISCKCFLRALGGENSLVTAGALIEDDFYGIFSP